MNKSLGWVIGLHGVGAALMGWLYIGDLADAMRARAAEVAAMPRLPNALFAAGVMALMLASLAIAALGVWRSRGPDFKGYRLLPIVAVVALFLDLFVVSADAIPIAPPDHLEVTLTLFQQRAAELSTKGRVLTDAERLSSLLEELGAPHYLVRGHPISRFQLQVRQACAGPVLEAPGAAPGTVLYCVEEKEKSAWVSVVALPAERRFGEAALFSRNGRPVVVRVVPAEAGLPAADGGI